MDEEKEKDVPDGLKIAAGWSWRLIVIAIAVVGVAWCLAQVRLVVVSLMIAVLLSALLSPCVYWLRSHRVRPGWATALTELGMIGCVATLMVVAGQQIIQGFSEMGSRVHEGYHAFLEYLALVPFSVDGQGLAEHVDRAVEQMKMHSDTFMTGALSVGSTVMDVGTGLAIVLFTLIFFLLEGEKIWLFLVRLFPAEHVQAVNGAGRAGWVSLKAYVKVQVLVAVFNALGIGAGALILEVPLVVPLTILVFLSSFIPIVGGLTAGIVATLLSLVSNGLGTAVIMLIVVIVVQQVEGHIMQPLVMGHAVSLHPLAVVCGVASGSILWGILGAFFAVPVMAFSNSAIRYVYGRRWEFDEPSLSVFMYPHERERLSKPSLKQILTWSKK